tara:strand:+ start:64 stop:228 length:165 start_codon:yes stop_codon:yes gene_type:complete
MEEINHIESQNNINKPPKNDFKENQSYSFYGSCVGRRILGKKFIFVDVIECEEP